MNRNQVAAKVAINKQQHPDKFCPQRGCLWRTGDGSYCPRHRQASASREEQNARYIDCGPQNWDDRE